MKRLIISGLILLSISRINATHAQYETALNLYDLVSKKKENDNKLKEKIFTQKHLATPEEEQIINEIFSNLDPKLYELFNGKSVTSQDAPKEYRKLLEDAGFTIYAMRIFQCEEKYSDGYPARVVLTHEKLPDYFIKIGFDRYSPRKNISRVMYTELINTLVDDPKLNITTIKKNQKKICHRPNRLSDDLTDMNYIILSLKQEGTPGADYMKIINGEINFYFPTQKQHDDCMFLKKTLDIRDFSPGNCIFDADGKIVFIDTEILQDYVIDAFFETFVSLT